MLKASALYMVIIIALVIGIICSSLVVTAYFYRLQYQKTDRFSTLQNNLSSAINILMASEDTTYLKKTTFSLFNTDADSVAVQKLFWGVYDIGVARAFIQKDTLYKTFSLANSLDSTKWAALYLADDQRPLGLSGKTTIKGNAFIPPAGVNQAYVNNEAYSGDKRLIIGTKHDSQKYLPALDADRLERFKTLLKEKRTVDISLLKGGSVNNPFLSPTQIVSFGNHVTTLKNISLSGNIILFSDTALVIDSTAVLNHIIVFAKSITVHSGFHGNCQLFVTDTMGIGRNCRFSYPSCLGLLRFDAPGIVNTMAQISLQNKCAFSGLIFTYEKEKSIIPPIIHIGSKVKVKGQIYSQGFLEFDDYAEVDGSVTTAKFLYQSSFTRYENYINNTVIDDTALSPYYLSSDLIPVTTAKKKIVQWLEAN